ncbi:hypothetical protein DID77_01345 [Candidatus Marinamargulisbacteria bacterium SCGC AG-439-L15]|nr:hypothetical protein DID77_01345 [Candidatus Marinamargulisbacteria bacterium SCGC AG-439-L15]
MKLYKAYLFSGFLLSLLFITSCGKPNNKLHIATTLSASTITPITDMFSRETGIPILLTEVSSNIAINETKADIFLTTDITAIQHASNSKQLQEIDSPILETQIEPYLKSRKKDWFMFTINPYTIVFNSDAVWKDDLSNYENLKSQKWFKRLCLGSDKTAMKHLKILIRHQKGNKKANQIFQDWHHNLSEKEQNSDLDLLNLLNSGQCDVSIVHASNLALFLLKNNNSPLQVFWANQKTTGPLIQGSMAGIIKGSPHFKEASRFLEWLTEKEPQEFFSKQLLSYPIRKDIPIHSIFSNWNTLKISTQNIRN